MGRARAVVAGTDTNASISVSILRPSMPPKWISTKCEALSACHVSRSLPTEPLYGITRLAIPNFLARPQICYIQRYRWGDRGRGLCINPRVNSVQRPMEILSMNQCELCYRFRCRLRPEAARFVPWCRGSSAAVSRYSERF